MSEHEKLERIRAQIDALDRQIQDLLNERARFAQEVAQVKRAAGDDNHFYRPEREAQILQEIKSRNQGPLSAEEVARLFREIMSACLALEQPLKISFLGPEGTFTQAAALKHFGHSVTTLPLATIDEVFREVSSGAAQYGVVPVENSSEGVVTHTLDMFMQSQLSICGEVQLRIHHLLLSGGSAMADIRQVYSHQQSLGQCREWLDRHLPGAERIAVSSNAEAARRIANKAGAAAIAGDAAAEIYGLTVLAHNIEDQPENTTRFLVIGNQSVPRSGKDKTSLLVSAQNRAGALYRLLTPFVEHGISMTRIESRPSRRGMWEYVFFVDVEGHVDDEPVAKALEALSAQANMCKVLGSYPQAVL